MPRFFISSLAGNEIALTGEDAFHIAKTLRMKAGEALTLCDGAGSDYACVITRVDPAQVVVRVEAVRPTTGEPSLFLTLYQALPKGDKMDTIIQKTVELGVSRIVPVITQRCVSRPDIAALAKKVARWQKIAKEAAQQCGRGIVPQVCNMQNFTDTVLNADADVRLFFYELGGAAVQTLLPAGVKNCAMMIGSEGGFAESEAAFACNNGFFAAGLGPRILRCETAPVVAASVLMHITGNLS